MQAALLTFIGIVVIVGVGAVTFILSERRARRSKWQTTKDMITRDLSWTLGEGDIPALTVVQSTINSVLRTVNAKDLNEVTADEIVDELVR